MNNWNIRNRDFSKQNRWDKKVYRVGRKPFLCLLSFMRRSASNSDQENSGDQSVFVPTSAGRTVWGLEYILICISGSTYNKERNSSTNFATLLFEGMRVGKSFLRIHTKLVLRDEINIPYNFESYLKCKFKIPSHPVSSFKKWEQITIKFSISLRQLRHT